MQTKPSHLIVVHDVDRVGAGLARNSVVNRVATPWVAFIDDDDILDPHYAEWLEEEAQDNDVVVFHMQYMQQIFRHLPKGQIIPRPGTQPSNMATSASPSP